MGASLSYCITETEEMSTSEGKNLKKEPQEPEQNLIAQRRATAFLCPLFKDFENDVFVRHVALFLQESNEQAALKNTRLHASSGESHLDI